MKNIRKIVITGGIFLTLLVSGGSVQAQNDVDSSVLYGGVDKQASLGTTLGMGTEDPRIIAANVIRVLLGFLGLVALCLVLYAGWLWMKSGDNPEQIEKAKKILKSAVIGLLIILSAFAIASFIISSLMGAAGLGGNDDNGGGGMPEIWDTNSFHVVSTEPTDGEGNIFRNPSIQLWYNRELDRSYSTTTLSGQFQLEKIAQYLNVQGSIDEDTASTTTGLPQVVAVAAASSSLRTANYIKPLTACQFVDSQGATTTITGCLDAWAQYRLTVRDTLLSVNGETLDCHLGCQFTFTTNDSIDIGKPVITALSPVGGFCSKATNTPCLVHGDCGTDDKCDLKTPNARPGNLVTINGRNFGNTRGHVYFSTGQPEPNNWREARLASDVNADCDDDWTANQVVAEFPGGLPATSSVRLVDATPDRWEDVSNDGYGPRVADVLQNDITRPGLCRIDPSRGQTGTTTVYYGLNLIGSEAFFGTLYSRIAASGPFTAATVGTGFVPNVRTGTTSTFALRDKTYSNYLKFHREEAKFSGPVIASFNPVQGNKGQYVTIFGNGFGNASLNQLGKSHRVYFAQSPSLFSTTSLASDGAEAEYKFPEICSADLWTDSQITVKVPDHANMVYGQDYYIYLLMPKQGTTSVGWFVNSAAIQTPGVSRVFGYRNIELTPGVCAIKPAIGAAGDLVALYGEYFPTAPAPGNEVVFQAGKVAASVGWLDNADVMIAGKKYGKADQATTTVPSGAVSGAVRVKTATSQSNTRNFAIGKCTKDFECGGGSFCCVSGMTSEGTCAFGPTREAACFSNILSSVYEWSFSTALATSSQTCSGFTNANACLLASACPNSPGSCQSGISTNGERCDSDACSANANCTDSKGSNLCSYVAESNRCASVSGSCSISDLAANETPIVLNAENSSLNEDFATTPGLSIVNDGANNHIYRQLGNHAHVKSLKRIAVDTSKLYYLAGRFRSVGTSQAPLYFGLAPYDAGKAQINSWQNFRFGNPGTISSFNDSTIVTSEALNNWIQSGTSYAYSRSLAFYFDGNTSIMPTAADMVYELVASTLPTSGAYSSTSQKEIHLNSPLPAAIANRIVIGKTKVMDHSAGSSLMYNAATHDITLNANWSVRSALLAGEAYSSGNFPSMNFWPGIKYAELLLLMNYSSAAGMVTEFDDLFFGRVDCNAVGSERIYQINTAGKPCPLGTQLDARNGKCTLGTVAAPQSCTDYRISCNRVEGVGSVYQIEGAVQSCPSTAYLDVNGKCTFGTRQNPSVCQTCPSGFACNQGRCEVNQPVCLNGSKCVSGACVADFACECCCKVENQAQDCCTGLECKPGLCVNDEVGGSGTPIYGQCTGCKVEVGGVVDQARSNDACRCKSPNRYCNTNPRVYLNGQWVDNDTGVCQDAAQLGEPCSADPSTEVDGSGSPVATSSLGTSTEAQAFWRVTKSGNCPAGTFIESDTRCIAKAAGSEPLTCPTAGATSTSVVPGYLSTCNTVATGVNYWQVGGQIPCPASTYLDWSSTLSLGWCTAASAMPYACSQVGATSSSILLGGVVATCEAKESWYEPSITFKKSSTSTVGYLVPENYVGNIAGYYQLGAAATGVFHDYNGQFTVGQQPQTCTVANQRSTTVYPGATTTCNIVPGEPYGYWQLEKPSSANSGLSCPAGTFLAASNASTSWPWCTVGDTPYSCAKQGEQRQSFGNLSLSDKATCNIFQYKTSASEGAAFCSDTTLPQCDDTKNLVCDPRSCSCQPQIKQQGTTTVRAGELCKLSAAPSCTVGVDSCDEANTSLQCRSESLQDCRCCCNPGVFGQPGYEVSQSIGGQAAFKNVFDSTGNLTELVCKADKDPCSGNMRGLFCGCKEDLMCSGGLDGCGLDGCCRARPTASSTYPHNNAQDICRNSVVKLEFKSRMDQTSFGGNMIVVGDYGTQSCPNATTYLTTIKPIQGWWSKLVALIKRTFSVGRETAIAQNTGNYCAVKGHVRAANGNRNIEFVPEVMLDAGRTYYVIVPGDASTTDRYAEGVVSADGIGFHDDDGTFGSALPTGRTQDFDYASSSASFNGRRYFGYVWRFTTRPATAANQGVCLLDHVKTLPSGFENPAYTFTTLKNDASDDSLGAAEFDTVDSDVDKLFVSHAYSQDDVEIASIPGVYDWAWSWQIDNNTVVKERALAGLPSDSRMLEAQNKKDAQTYVNGKATVQTDAMNNTAGNSKSGKALIHVFLCENPWPTFNPAQADLWPWKDADLNCTQNNTPGSCSTSNFEFYYCRDTGKEGTKDDLPAMNSDAPILGNKNGGLCDAGLWFGKACTINSDYCFNYAGMANIRCEAGKCRADGQPIGGNCTTDEDCKKAGNCKAIMKEFYFLRSDLLNNSTLNFRGVPLAAGKAVRLSWNPVAGVGYKVYYGNAAGSHTQSLEVAPTQTSVDIGNLMNGKTYYFTMTVINADRQESEEVPEIALSPADTEPPATPANLRVTAATESSVTVTWDKAGDSTVKYKVYYGTIHALPGKVADVGSLNSYTIKSLALGTQYFVSVVAYDQSGNESTPREANEIIAQPNKLTYYQNTLTSVDFENVAVGALPVNWIRSSQTHSSIQVTNAQALSGSQSIVLHQDAGYNYPGTCTQAICAYTPGCTWLASTQQCSFNTPDATHPVAPSVYNLNQTFSWPNTSRVMWGSLYYNISNLAFEVGKRYMVAFYYKGNTRSALTPLLSISPGWSTLCIGKPDPNLAPGGVCKASSNMFDCPANSNYCCRDTARLVGGVRVDLPFPQQNCHASLSMGSIPAGDYQTGPYDGWTLYQQEFVYTTQLQALRDPNTGNKIHYISLNMNYANTGGGADLYIDNFLLAEAQTS